MNRTPTTVLLVGATGTFGRLLARQLMCERNVRVILAGRTEKTLQELADELDDGPCGTQGTKAGVQVLDRNHVTAKALHATGARIVIDAAGPFQNSSTNLIEAAIGACIHYIDLADARDFVRDISRFDESAQKAGIAVMTGASTSPAITHAAVTHLTRGWQRIDTLRVALSLGAGAPKGLSVVRAGLSYAGQKIRVFRDAYWTTARGWSHTKSVDFPGLGPRLVSLCETPDLDLLTENFRPRIAAEFRAGLEQPGLHRLLGVASRLVRWRLLPSLEPFAKLARRIALQFSGRGTDRGGLVVEAKGQNMDGHPVIARWSLAGAPGMGPYVPTLPALALVRRLHHGSLDFTGAAPCTGFLNLTDLASDFVRVRAETKTEVIPVPESPFKTALGDAFDTLYLMTQDVHRPDPVVLLRGEAEVEGGTGLLSRILARLFAFPPPQSRAPLHVVIKANEDGREDWARVYPTRTMRSVMGAPDAATRTIEEAFGAFRFRLRLDLCGSRLALVPVGAWWGRFQIPRVLRPRIHATERAAGGRHFFDVSVALPFIGRLVHYRGWLALQECTASSDRAVLPATSHSRAASQTEPIQSQIQL